MGYSVGIDVQSVHLQKKMLTFMEKEYRPHWQIRGRKNTDCYSSPPRVDLDYFQGKCIIGMDYNAAGFERGYVFTLARWMALKVAKTRRVFNDPQVTFEEPVPYIVYDNYNLWPVLVKPLSAVPKKIRWCCVDRYGMKLSITQTEDYVFELPDEKAFEKAHRKACEKHGIEPNSQVISSVARERIRDTRMRLLWPEVKKVLAPMRAEMKRLDQAWARNLTKASPMSR